MVSLRYRKGAIIMKAIYAGSFDPFTNGHLSIVREASKLFDTVYVCIGKNSSKQRFVDETKMQHAIKMVLLREGIINSEVVVFNGMVADLAQKLGVDYLVRGLRNSMDYAYEENIAKINSILNPTLKTVYFRASSMDGEVISSSMIREFLKYEKDVCPYVPIEIVDILKGK